MEEFNYKKPFAELIKNNEGRYAILVTKSQYALITDEAIKYATHLDLYTALAKKIRPDLTFDEWGKVLNSDERIADDAIVIFGYPHYFQFQMTERSKMSPEQFNCIKDMLFAIKDENAKIDEKGYGIKHQVKVLSSQAYKIVDKVDYGNDIDGLLEQLSKYVAEPEKIPTERIIGKQITQNISKEESQQILFDETILSNSKGDPELADWDNFDWGSTDWDNDFPIFEEDEEKKVI